MIPRLETDHLVLRAFDERDLDRYAEMVASVDVARYTTGTPMSREDAWRQMATILGHWTLRGYGTWAVEEKATGLFVGRTGLWNPEGWPGIEVGWALHPDAWDKGYATEAARASVAWGRDTLGLTRILSVIHPENARSIAVAERLGLHYERPVTVRGVQAAIYAGPIPP